MEAPKSFKESLKTQFNDRLRIRWSNKNQEWQIEEKIARASLPKVRTDDTWDDQAVRERDGYAYICAVRPGDRMPCPTCNSTLEVPINEFGEVKCSYCVTKGRKVSLIAGFFSLGGILLEHLRRLDPLRGWRDRNIYEDYDSWKEKKIHQQIENMSPIWGDHYRRLVGIPMVGYTRKEKI